MKHPPALAFGVGIHAALEAKGNGSSLSQQIIEFDKHFHQDYPPTHTRKGGHLILKEYATRYEDDDLEVLENEYEFSVRINGYVFHGRYDKIVRARGSESISVLDHKTTSRLGDDFYNSTTPNGQFTGYIYSAQCEFGEEVDSLIVDGILKPYAYKTKPMVTDFQRVVVSRTEYELDQWKRNTHVLLDNLKRYADEGYYPMHDNGFYCSRCDFRELCLTPERPDQIEVPEDQFAQRTPH